MFFPLEIEDGVFVSEDEEKEKIISPLEEDTRIEQNDQRTLRCYKLMKISTLALMFRTHLKRHRKHETTDESETADKDIRPSDFVILDVRDEDGFGGHIPTSLNIPSRIFKKSIDSLIDRFRTKRTSQHRCLS